LYFVGFLALSLVYSSSRLDGLRLVLKVAYPVLIFFVVIKFSTTLHEVESALRYWIGGGLVATAVGATKYLIGDSKEFTLTGDFRYSSGLLHASPFSMYMFALFALCYVVWRASGRWGYAALASLFGLQALMAQTRITWAAIVVSLFIYEAWMGKGLRSVLRAAGLAAGIGACLVYLVWHSTELQRRFFSTEAGAPGSLEEVVESLNVSGRNLVWAETYNDYQSHNLWVGQGAGSSTSSLYRVFGEPFVPHNEYLRVVHDTGLVGLLLFLGGIVGLFRLLHSLLLNRTGAEQRLFIGLAVMLLTGYVIEAITDNPLDYYLVYSQYVFYAVGVATQLVFSTGAQR
jgi:hypothetical protein